MAFMSTDSLSGEQHVGAIRAAIDSGDRTTAEQHFTALLQASRQSTESWLRHVIGVTPALRNMPVYTVCEELRQELALYLWQRIACQTQRDMVWETVYWSALVYAQRHVAAAYMSRAGYWVLRTTTKQPERGLALWLGDYLTEMLEAPDMLSVVECTADVQAVLMQLRPRERAAVVLRYWQNMREQDIASILGCSDRTVRTLLQRAHQQVGVWYEQGPQQVVGAAGAREMVPD